MKIVCSTENNQLKVIVSSISQEHYGRDMEVSFVVRVRVHDSRPVNGSETIVKKTIQIHSPEEIIFLTINKNFYKYIGEKISIIPQIFVKIDDSYLFDTKISKKILNELSRQPSVLTHPKKALNPKDSFNWIYSIKSISYTDRVKVFLLMWIWAIVIIINTILGIHDQFSPENMTYFYSQYASDWDSSSPFMKSLAWSGTVWGVVWFWIRLYLRRYMTFRFKNIKWNYGVKDHRYKLSHLIDGKSRVDLNNVTIKIVAWNIERWKYTRGSGTKKRTVSFRNPVKAIEIFSKKYDFIPKETSISDYIAWDFSFQEMYKALYPECFISSSYWIFVHWEVQLIHDKLVDQELVGKNDICKYEYFLDAK